MLDPSFFKQAAPAGALVSQMAIAALATSWVGAKLDGWLDTSPWLFLTGLCLGSVTGFILLFRGLNRLDHSDEDPPDPHQ